MKPRTTQADVARKAGVHVTTVSLALRNSPRLPLETRKKLQNLALELGYRPDPDLSALVAYRKSIRRSKQVTTLAYVTCAGGRWDWKNAPAHADFFRGASSRAPQLGYQLEHFWLGEPGLTPRRLSDILFSRGISGIVFASHWACDRNLHEMDWSRFAAVAIDPLQQLPTLHTVTNDQRLIIQTAVRRVRAAGYRRIGFVIPHWWAEIGNLAWSAGFLAEQLKFSADERIPILFYGIEGIARTHSDLAVTAPEAEFGKWFAQHQPEVILSYSPFVLPRLEAMGLQVPRDVGFVDIFLENATGTIAGVRQNCARVGELAIEVLASHLQQHTLGLPSLHTTTLVDGTWCDGASLPAKT